MTCISLFSSLRSISSVLLGSPPLPPLLLLDKAWVHLVVCEDCVCVYLSMRLFLSLKKSHLNQQTQYKPHNDNEVKLILDVLKA